jgi:energy-coupling factor transporter transmembrane protein EcfT
VALARQRPAPSGPLSSFDPAARILCLALLSSSSLLAGWPFALALCLACFILLALEGLKLSRICVEASFVLAFALFAALLKLFSGQGSGSSAAALGLESGIYCLKLLAAFLAGRLLYASTSLSQLRDASTRIARRLPFGKRSDLGLALALILGYLPLIVEEWRSSLEAARSRGMSRHPGLGLQARFLAAFLRRLMLRAVALPEALAARGWTRDRGVAEAKWELKETLLLSLCCACLVLAMLHIV